MMEKEQSEEFRKEWTLTVLKLIHARKNHLDEVLRLTREIGETLDRNDQVSVQMLLEMRGKELEQIDEGIQQLELFKGHLSPEIQLEIDQLLKKDGFAETKDAYAMKILETSTGCRKLLDEIITIDRRMSKRIAGSDSFYKE